MGGGNRESVDTVWQVLIQAYCLTIDDLLFQYYSTHDVEDGQFGWLAQPFDSDVVVGGVRK